MAKRSLVILASATNADGPSFRPYGPGKFDYIVDQVIHAITLDGHCDEESGEVEGNGWHGLIRGALSMNDVILYAQSAGLDNLTASEIEYLTDSRTCGGFIVTEDSQGFVTVSRYLPDEVEAAWAEVLAEDAAVTEDAEA